jgi:hypothetical protein
LRFATVAVIGSGWLLSSNEILPMPGTLGQDFILRGGLQPPPLSESIFSQLLSKRDTAPPSAMWR